MNTERQQFLSDNSRFELIQLQKMKIHALLMEYMQAFGQESPERMKEAVSNIHGILPILRDIATRVSVDKDQRSFDKPKNNA